MAKIIWRLAASLLLLAMVAGSAWVVGPGIIVALACWPPYI